MSDTGNFCEKWDKYVYGRELLKEFKFLKVIGRGTYGKVMLAEKKGTDEVYAVKVLSKQDAFTSTYAADIFTERRVLSLAARHPFLASLHSTFQTESRLFFVMEFVNGGDILVHLENSGRFEERRARFYVAEIALALSFLHKNKIVYRDLKFGNILLNEDGHIKLVDFGMCREGITNENLTKSFCGTLGIIAPEIMEGKSYGFSVDWWTLGVAMYQMMTYLQGFNLESHKKYYRSVKEVDKLHYPLYLSKNAVSLLRGFLTLDPSKRIGTNPEKNFEEEIFNHEFFKEIDWKALEEKKVEPPYIPGSLSKTDTSYVSTEYTNDNPELSPIKLDLSKGSFKDELDDFNYVNPEFTNT